MKFLILFTYLFSFTCFSEVIELQNSKQDITSRVKVQNTKIQTKLSPRPFDFLEKVRLEKPHNNFELVNKPRLSNPYNEDILWMNFQVKNTTDESITKILHFDSDLTGFINLYEELPNGEQLILKARTGSALIFKKRDFPSLKSSLKISVDPNSEKTIWLARFSRQQFDTKIYLTNELEFLLEDRDQSFILIFYTGCIIFLLFSNIFLGYFSKDFTYSLYCVFLISIAATVLSIYGALDSILFKNNFLNFNHNLLFFVGLTIISSLTFASKFLNVKENFKKALVVRNVLILIAGLHSVLALTPIMNRIGVKLGTTIDITLLASCTWLLYVAIVSSRKKVTMANFYLVSIGFIISSCLLWFGAYYGVFPTNHFTTNAILYGNLGEMFAISVGLAYKVSIFDLRVKNARARERDKERYQKLVRVLCHDIANSLFIISGFTRRLKRRPELYNAKETWDKVEKASHNIAQILENVKIQESIDTHKGKLKLNDVCLKEVIDESLFIFEDKLKKKNITLDINFQEGSSLVTANKVSLLHNVINNVISNAIKFSYENSKLSIAMNTDFRGKTLTIQDYGIGIPEDSLILINANKDILSTTGTHGEKGTGYGISIIRSYMQTYKGDLKISSKAKADGYGQTGTTIELFFPLA